MTKDEVTNNRISFFLSPKPVGSFVTFKTTAHVNHMQEQLPNMRLARL